MPNGEHKGRLTGMILLLSASIVWGVAFVAQSAGMDYMGPFTFTAVRSALAALGLGGLVLLFDWLGLSPKNTDKKLLWRAGLILGVVMTVASNLQQIGLMTTSAGKSGFITSLYIVFVPIFGLFIKRRPHPMLWICVVLAAVGLYFLSIRGDFTMSLGDLSVLGCAVVFTFQILLVDHYASKVDIMRLNFIQFSVMALLSAVPMALFEEPKMANIMDAWLTLLYAGLFSGCVAYSLQMFGQRRLEPTTASLLLSLEAVFSAIAGWLILGQVLEGRELLGCGLVFAAVVASQLPWQKLFSRKPKNVLETPAPAQEQ
ncbi:MAG TPA: DMT family transporter [Feifaniaceae bacterium]|nr:DMT family transporter [Feifaniaceae bacterium]